MTRTTSRWARRLATLLLGSAALASSASAQTDLLVTSQTNGRVLHYDGTTGAYEGVFIANGKDGLSGATALVVGADGKLYVGVAGGVMRFDLATGSGATFVSGLPAAPVDLTFGPDGNLYGTLGSVNQIFKASGVTGSILCQAGGGLPNYLAGIGFRSDGNLYASSLFTNQVFRYDPATCTNQGLFATVPIPGAAGNAAAVVFRPDGNLYVSLRNGNDIYRFDGTTGAPIGSFTQAPKPSVPRLFTFGADGHLYATALGTSDVRRYDGVTGAFIDSFAHSAGLDAPYDVVFVPDFLNPPGVQPPLVETLSGPVQGVSEQDVLKYQGIPYAEPPTGALRWKRPVRKGAWTTPFDASGFGPMCPQPSGSSAIGDEDCLKISLWAPPVDPNAPPLPVLFYIHGGGHVTGGAGGIADGTAFALNQNVIVAEAQYRLGALGFFGLPALAAEDPNASTGNNGLLDQLEALRWLRDNVAAFGGDPNQITIAGESAGGHSVCGLLASPLSDGLFRAGIVQSGQCIYARPLDLPATSPVLTDPLFGPTVYQHSSAVAGSAGCGASDLACLRGKSAVQMVQALAAQPKLLSGEPRAVMAVDGYVLSETPLAMLRQGAADQRPLMIGSVANEATLFVPSFPPALYETILRQQAGNTRADALLPLYPAGSDPVETFRWLFEDTLFVCPALDAADAVAANGSPAWVYHMTFPPTYLPSSPDPTLRTFHSLDVYYVFGTYPQLTASRGIAIGPADFALSVSMQNAWGSFVRTGVPMSSAAWPAYAPTTPGDLASVSVLNFDVPTSLTPGNLFRTGRCAALLPVVNFLDADRDVATYEEDDCPVTANINQADAELDTVGDACDNCRNVANARVAADFLTANPWATLTGGQRDDDHDGYGNKCDAKFPGVAGNSVSGNDLNQFRASNGKPRSEDTCGTNGARPCAIFDLDESANSISGTDLARFRLLNGLPPGPKCPTCPLACTAGPSGNCP